MNRYGVGTDVAALFVLAVGACAFTAVLEAIWIWVYHGFDPWQTLSFNFDLNIGPSAALQVLILGLAVALGAAWRKSRWAGQGLRSAR
jgi:hypothetical protein